MTAWSETDDATLKRMHDDGASFHEIYMALGGRYSRNACIGRAHRLFLRCYTNTPVQGFGQPRLSKRQRQKERLRKRGTDGAMGSALATRMKRGAVSRANQVKFTEPVMIIKDQSHLAVSLFDVKESQCRWPLDEVGGPNGILVTKFRFCGAQKRDGSSYCEAHWRRSLQCYRMEYAEAAE